MFEAKNNKENCKSAEACHIDSFDFYLFCNGLQPIATYHKLPLCRYIEWAEILRLDSMAARDRCLLGLKFGLEISTQSRPAQVSQSAHFFRSIKQAFILILNEKTRVWRIFWTAHCESSELRKYKQVKFFSDWVIMFSQNFENFDMVC